MSINVLRMTSKFFKLLSDVNVLKIILLLKNNEKSFQIIQNNLNITQSHQSHLMRKLIDSNILIVSLDLFCIVLLSKKGYRCLQMLTMTNL